MRRVGTHAPNLVARVRMRLAGLVGDPTPPMTEPIDPAEAAAWAAIVNSNEPFPATEARGEEEPRAPRFAPARPVTSLSSQLVAQSTGVSTTAPPTPAQTVTPPTMTPRSNRRRQPGDTAPEFLLQAPAGIDSVVDNFLEGVEKRVEGDR